MSGDLRYGVGEEPLYFELPFLNLTGEQHCTTGYQLKKGSDPYCVDTENAETGVIVFRYAEALLNYAEAKAELGEITQEDVDKTINVIRQRVGVAGLQLNITRTTRWQFLPLSPIINEVRRERRVVLRKAIVLDDLMRWRSTRTDCKQTSERILL